MDVLIEVCQNKDLAELKSLFSVDNLEQCIDACVYNDFPEGLRFILNHSPKCIRPIVENPEMDHETWWFDPHLDNMIYSVQFNKIECMRAFLDHGCDPNGGVGAELYPPILSVESIPMAKLLLSYNADINASCIPDPYDIYNEDRYIEDRLFEAICERLVGEDFEEISPDRELILFLIEKGLHCYPSRDYLVRLLECSNFEMLRFFHEKLGFDLNVTNHWGENLLFDVIVKRNVKGVTFLLEHNVGNTVSKRGQTPLEYAMELDHKWPSEKIHTIVELVKLASEDPIKDPGID
jgi:hypothetical protein